MANNAELVAQCRAKAQEWLSPSFDEKTRAEVQALLDKEDPSDLIDAFYQNLEFGTGGLRGTMGVGTNRMNKYIVAMATQGFANYVLKSFPGRKDLAAVVGHDCRNNGRDYAETVAAIFTANGIKAYLFESLRPTPEISFAIRQLGAQCGVNVTASHNPKEYNGYKAYWEDEDVKWDLNPDLLQIIGGEMDFDYMQAVKEGMVDQDVILRNKDLNIVYSAMHGTGRVLVPLCLRSWGFQNINVVPEQMVVDGNFPTVVSPNPENPEAMTLGIKLGTKLNADLVVATDPDADRLAIVCRNGKGEWQILNGNQTACMFYWYTIKNKKALGQLKPSDFMVKTIVTSELIAKIAKANGVECFDEYTGFKWIAYRIRVNEGKRQYIGGGEESFGYLPYDKVRDKDAPASICLICEIAAWAKDQGKTLFDLLLDIYKEYGFQKETTINVVKPGKSGADEIKAMMENFRQNPPQTIAGSKVVTIKDYKVLKRTDNGVVTDFEMPTTSNVLQWFTEDGLKVSVRPSGTEPKIKFYCEVPVPGQFDGDYVAATAKADARVEEIKKDLGL